MKLEDFAKLRPRITEITVFENSVRIDFKDKEHGIWNMVIFSTDQGTQIDLVPVSLLRNDRITVTLRPAKIRGESP